MINLKNLEQNVEIEINYLMIADLKKSDSIC